MQALFKNKYLLLLLFGLTISIVMVSCDKDEPGDKVDPNKIELLSFGPSPALRGADLQFIGRNMDKVTEIVLPSNVKVTNFKSKAADKVVIVVPEETVDGLVTLKTPQGDIVTKSLLTISEPITIVGFSPANARPGATVTITGTYLNLIEQVIFATNKVVAKANFVSQTRDKIEVIVPADAKSGKIAISNGKPSPIIVETETEFGVTLPAFTTLNPSPVKAGGVLTIGGTDLDLITEIAFEGGSVIKEFDSKTATEIKLKVPSNARDGVIKASVPSLEQITSAASVVMVVPTFEKIEPNPGKSGQNITLTGKDLDLVTSVTFANGEAGTIVSKSETELVVTVAPKATEGSITLGTASTKTVVSPADLKLVVPVIGSFSATAIKSSADLAIAGTNMDLVVEVLFAGGVKGTNLKATGGEVIVTVPPGSKDGPVTLVTTNGTNIVSTESITILASNVPSITGYPTNAKPGQMIVLTGEKLNITTNVIFPGNVPATKFGVKTANMIEVVVPDDVKKGKGVITFVTFEGETTSSPEINFSGVDAVVDASLVFFNFDNRGAWWGKMQGNTRNDALSVDGTAYGFVNENLSGWNDMFWRNGKNDFPADLIGVNLEDYVLKIDINVLEPITGGSLNLHFRPGDDGAKYWLTWGPGATDPQLKEPIEKTDGWVTKTFELTNFRDNYGWGSELMTDLSVIGGQFGMAFDSGSSKVNILMDNVRFEKIK